MKDRDKIILKKILKYCSEIKEAKNHFENSFELFKTNSIFLNSCCMCILQIGELCKILSDETKDLDKEIPWRAWCGIRDVFAHQHSNIDYEMAWETIQKDLPELKKRVTKIL